MFVSKGSKLNQAVLCHQSAAAEPKLLVGCNSAEEVALLSRNKHQRLKKTKKNHEENRESTSSQITFVSKNIWNIISYLEIFQPVM